MSEAVSPTSIEEDEARALAEQVGLEYREPSAVAIDPRALSILPASDCRRLRAVPLAGTAGNPVVAISDPSAERLDSVRELTGSSTRFVVLSDKTIDALLRSRMFTSAVEAAPVVDASRSERPQYEVHQPAPDPVFGPEPVPVNLDVQAEQPVAPAPLAGVDGGLVDAIVKALEPKLRSVTAQTTQGQAATDSIWDPVARVDATIEAWSNLRAALETIGEELDSSRGSLREVKEQLAAANASNDQQQRRIDALEAELSERNALFNEARSRLQDAAKALGGVDVPDDLL